ncbi:acylneuraminate cytidylyltransferase, partial [Campylobacter jejuni]|nr:acylneuraminate cytidylyltransferase [Campylobacter jejuni]
MIKNKYVAEIPARLGSKRVKQKNLRLIDGEPMIAYAIKACKNVDDISEIYVNTESDIIGQVALDYGVKYYKRKQELSLDH